MCRASHSRTSTDRESEILHGQHNESHQTTLESANHPDALEPIAIVGLSLRFPQDAVSPDTFWQLLVEGRSALTEIPKDRFNLDAFYHPDATRTNSLNVRGGHFVRDDIAAFDAPFFSISPAEASCMDPQQRGLLECAYRALENVGIPLTDMAGSKTSVHVGSFSREYETILLRDPELQAKYMATGTGTAMLANRLSWFFNLIGPSIAVDTACSSSLLALHLACQSLRSGESTMGVVAGCNLLYNPDLIIPMTNINFLSPDSKCYSFDHRANGYSRGEGFGVVVIKPLSKALQDGNTIRAVIRATGTNQDGRTPGITQPSSVAQEKLIRETYKAGGLDLKTTRFFEAHGTGTPVGDPIEAGAIGAVFGSQRSKEDPLFVGALKSNIGHLEGASGIAGLIKSVLVLERGIIPPNIWFERPNPKILLGDWNIKFPLEPTSWPSKGLRRVSVNSFGFGGSNVHVVLDDAYHYLTLRNLSGYHHTIKQSPSLLEPSASPEHQQPSLPVDGAPHCQQVCFTEKPRPRLLIFSAFDEGGLKRLASLYGKHVAKQSLFESKYDSTYFEDLVYTVCKKRSSLPWKSFAIADSTIGLQRRLDNSLSKPLRSSHVPRLAFLFTGQGAQWCGMGRELVVYSVFQDSLQKADAFLKSLGCKWSIFDEFTKGQESSRMNDPALSQPLCTVLQMALVDLLRSWCIYPSAVVGHSSGEIAAAYCVGSLSSESAWKIAYFRGIVSAQVAVRAQRRGAMMSVGLSRSKVQYFLNEIGIEGQANSVVVGCINSPENVTLTGVEEQIDAIQALLERHQVFARKLKVGVAYHSTYMDEVALEYKRLLKELSPGCTTPPSPTAYMFSTVTGEIVGPDRLIENEYWVRNLTSPVQFMHAFTSMSSHFAGENRGGPGGNEKDLSPIDHLLEIGPHSTLQGPVKDILKSIGKYKATEYSSVLSRGTCSAETSLTVAGRLHCLGYQVDIMVVNHLHGQPRNPCMLVDLPEYPFNHSQRYWLESRISKDFRFRKNAPHELLGTSVRDWNPLEPRWRNVIRQSESPWISDHKVHGITLYPASGMLIMAIEAMRQLQSPNDAIDGYRLKEVEFLQAIQVAEGQDGTEISFVLRPHKDDNVPFVWHDFRLFTYNCDRWFESCRGLIGLEHSENQDNFDNGRQAREDLLLARQTYADGRARCKTPIKSNELYEKLATFGYGFGPCFRTLNDVYCNDDGEATAIINPKEWIMKLHTNMVAKHVIHPTALDGILQCILSGLSQGGKHGIPTLVPTRIHEMWVSSALLNQPKNHEIKVHSTSKTNGLRETNSVVTALDAVTAESRVLIKGLQTTPIADTTTSSSDPISPKPVCFNLESKPDLDLLDGKQISDYCSKASKCSLADRDLQVEEVELACFISIRDTLQKISSDMLPSSKPHLVKYLAWMKYQVERHDSGSLLHDGPAWKDKLSNLKNREAMYERIKSSDPEGRLCMAVAKNLVPILTGQIDALELLFSGTLLDEYYHWTNKKEDGFDKVSAYLDAFVHKNPCTNILEIGAGTGGGTDSVLEVLTHHGERELGTARYSHFTFTDISPSFFEKARARFASQTNRMTFKILDISLDPVQQGFEAGGYDLIVASNVLHATPSLDTTLQNTRKLMKPGAKLMLFEMCNPVVLRTAFIFGLLPGWWLATENNRTWGPLLFEQDWHDVLIRNGFSGTDVVLRDHGNERTHAGSVILSTALAQTNGHAPPDLREFLIIATGGSTLQRNAATQIRSQLLSLGVPRCDVIDPQESAYTTMAQKSCISLLELETPILCDLNADRFAYLQKLVTTAKDVFWITAGGGQSADSPDLDLVTGFSRCIRSEFNNLRFVTLALEDSRMDKAVMVEKIVKVVESMLISDQSPVDKEYVEKNGVICINRIVEANYLNRCVFYKTTPAEAESQKLLGGSARSLTLTIASPGLLDTIQFVNDYSHDQPLHPGEVEVEVKATGLNFHDIAVLLGQVSSDQIGIECAGDLTRVAEGVEGGLKPGDRVLCMTRGSYNTYARCKAALVAKIPNDMSYVSAAATPIAYCTAYYSLYELGRLQRGSSVLIHCGAGGVGQAAIQLAKVVTDISKIYVTVGNNEKKQLIQDLYGILGDHIFSSRSLSFVEGIKRMTQDHGVDLVLNSLGGEKLRRSLNCVAPFGRFIDIGLKDVDSFGTLPILPFSKSITFSSFDLLVMMRDAPIVLGGVLTKVMALLKNQTITAGASHVFDYSTLEEAFRLLQGGRNLGKIVAVPHEMDLVPVVPDSRPSYYFDSEATYLISGGLGGIGRSFTRWMAARGARNFVLLSRSGAVSGPALELLTEMRAQGIRIETPACDISDERSLATVLAECRKTMPPFRGCIQAAMVLRDGIFENMKLDDFKAALRPKVQGSWNLHTQLPKGMDFFILLSSLNGILGSRSQSNYGAGNTYEDALAKHRINRGEKAVSLDIGMINSVGFVAELQIADSPHLSGYTGIEEAQLHAILEYYCDPVLPLLSLSKSQVMVGIETPAALKAKGLDEPYWLDEPICRNLFQIDHDIHHGTSASVTQLDYQALLQSAGSLAAAKDVLYNALKQKLSRVLSIPLEDFDGHSSINSYGTDSLVAVELRNWLSKEMGVDVAIFDILRNVGIADFSEMAAGRSSFVTFASDDTERR